MIASSTLSPDEDETKNNLRSQFQLSPRKNIYYVRCIQDWCFLLHNNQGPLIDVMKGIHTTGCQALGMRSLKLFRGVVDLGALLIDENARPHRAYIVDIFLEEQHVLRMIWPFISLELNPVENVWDGLGSAIVQRNSIPRPARS